MKKIILSIFMVGALVSCKTFSHSSRNIGLENKDVKANTFVLETVPDFSKKVKGSSTKKHTAEKSAKEEAYFNAIIDNNVDVLIDPIYSVTSTKKMLLFFGGKSQATVYGYAGFYKNPKSLKQVQQEELDQKVLDLEKLSEIKGLLDETEEKTNPVITKCTECKGVEASTFSIKKNKSSLVDVYKKLKK